ncbi:alpha/beta fold hydrolase [Lacibacter sp. H407]|uniref:alpha/beta fold hydrolase n=1 Tax=Lacibacter sp. H407 TaxID=3133423 RepID=UPI0030C3DB12
MKRTLLKASAYLVLITSVIFLVHVFFPRQYDVPKLQPRADTQFWHLSTGSEIGYTYFKGKGTKKSFPLIFLNGGPGGALTDEAIQLRSNFSDDGYDVYLYDQIGSGQSARLKNISGYTPERHRKDLEEIIKEIGAEKVILIGHSWGAILAVLFAAENQTKIDKIIFTCPGPIYPFRKELLSVKAPDSLHLQAPVFSNAQGNKKANNIRTKAMAFFATRFGWKIAGDKEADEFETYLEYEVNKSTVRDTSKIAPPEPGGGFYAAIMTFKNLLTVKDPRPQLLHSTIPVLVMKAQYDNQHWGFTDEYMELFPNHRLAVIPNAGHALSIEQPELYLKTIREFLAH